MKANPDLLEAAQHHEEMAEVRFKHAADQRENVAWMDKNPARQPKFSSPWEETKKFNLDQADFDEKWGVKHKKFAVAIRNAIEFLEVVK